MMLYLPSKPCAKKPRMKPSEAIQAAIIAYRRMKANERYLGTGELDTANDIPAKPNERLKKLSARNMKTTHIFTVDKADFDTYRTRTGKPFNRLWVND